MLKAYVTDYFCDVDDVLLLEEVGREVVTGRPIEPPRTSSSSFIQEVSVRLVEIKGVLWNRLATDSPEEPFSLEGIRLVAAVLKDSQIVCASTPSDPLLCPAAPTPQRHKHALAFEAQWSQPGGGTLSFDQPSSHTSPIKLVIALVNGNDMTEEFLLACPCGETWLTLSHQSTCSGDKREELAIQGLASPRNFVLYPSFHGEGQLNTTRILHKHTAWFNSRKTTEEKKSSESCNELELPYLSLENASLCMEVSWKQKELDVEVCYTGQEPQGNSLQEFVVDTRLKESYTPVRTHRLQKMEPGDTNDASCEGLESPISVRVGALDAAEHQPQVPLVTPNESSAHAEETSLAVTIANGGQVTPAIDNCGLEYQDGPELINQVMRSLALDDQFREESDSSKPLLSKASPRPVSETEGNKRKSGRKNPTKMTRGSTKKGKSYDTFSPDPPRHWTNAFRKPRSRPNQPTSSTSNTNLNDNVHKESAPLQNKEQKPDPHNNQSFARSKTDYPNQEILKRSNTERGSPLFEKASAYEELRIDKSRVDEISVLSIPKELQDLVPDQRANEVAAGTIQLLTSFCSSGDEVLTLNDQALLASDDTLQIEPHLQRNDCRQGKVEPCVTWVSHESVEPIQRDHKCFSSMFDCALLTPSALCSTDSYVTDYKIERRQSLDQLQSIEHFRSLEDTLSKRTNKTDEITTLSAVEDRMLLRTYHAMGGKHIDRVTDVLLRNAPGMIQQWLDRDTGKDRSLRTLSVDETLSYTEDNVLSLADVDFERAETGPRGALSPRLSTIAEESESGGLQTKSDSTEAPSAETNEDHGREVEAQGGITPSTNFDFVRTASF
eukprot:scaffold18324_cov176-Amphora_coffeaeformis.AAC.14